MARMPHPRRSPRLFYLEIVPRRNGLNFAICSHDTRSDVMNPSHVLGGIALVVGGGLLLSELLLGQELVVELTGTPMTLLRVWCGMVALLGVLALGFNSGDRRESLHNERGGQR
jgi:hypothetical protein